MYRLGRLNSYEEDNLSAHFSNESYPEFSDRPQTNTERSIPGENVGLKQQEILAQQRQLTDMKQKYTALEEAHRQLQENYRLMEQKYKNS
jgi:hypothetical protein